GSAPGLALAPFADTWEFDGANWNQIATAVSPPARDTHALAYDLVRGRTVLFGGQSPNVFHGDTWEYDANTWVHVATATAPSPRGYHGVAYDQVRARTVLFGGVQNSATRGDAWEYDGNAWTQAPPGPPPSLFRSYPHRLAFDVGRARTV